MVNMKLLADVKSPSIYHTTSSNVGTKSPLEPAGDNQKQVYIIQIWTHVEFLLPMTSLLIEICKPNTYRYLYYFSWEIIRRKCPAIGWVWGKLFQLDVSVKILHAIKMTLKDCIWFSESKNPYENKSNTLITGFLYHS